MAMVLAIIVQLSAWMAAAEATAIRYDDTVELNSHSIDLQG